jgi:predicted acetyltransferase
MNLVKASAAVLPGLSQLLTELGEGESGFGGASFGHGSASLDQFLRSCQEGEDPAKIGPEFVPQTIFWMIDDRGQAVGMVRVRHYLNDSLLQHGGHIGYYVCRAQRGKGYAKLALRMAVDFLNKRNVTRILVTVDPDNVASMHVALAAGGILDGQGRCPGSEEIVNRYWIE